MNANLHLFVCLQRNLRNISYACERKCFQQTWRMKQFRVVTRFSGPGWLSRYSDSHTGWTVLGSNPGGGKRFFSPLRTGPGAHPASCTIGTGLLSRGQSASGLSRPVLGGTLPFLPYGFQYLGERGKPVKITGSLRSWMGPGVRLCCTYFCLPL